MSSSQNLLRGAPPLVNQRLHIQVLAKGKPAIHEFSPWPLWPMPLERDDIPGWRFGFGTAKTVRFVIRNAISSAQDIIVRSRTAAGSRRFRRTAATAGFDSIRSGLSLRRSPDARTGKLRPALRSRLSVDTGLRRFPNRARINRFFRPFDCFLLLGILPSPAFFSKREVFDKCITPAVVYVSAHMGQLVQQAEPETVDSVIAESESGHRSRISEPERRPVEIRFRQLPFDHE